MLGCMVCSDFQNKEVTMCNVRPSMADFAACDGTMEGAYS